MSRSVEGLIHSPASTRAARHRRNELGGHHGHDRNAHLRVCLTRQAGRGPELELAEVVHGGDRGLEPSERLGSVGDDLELDHVQTEDVLPELAVQLLAAAVHHPGEMSELVESGAGSAERRVEQPRCGMLAGIEVGPALAHVHQTLADRVRDLGPVDDRAPRQHLDPDAALRHRLDAFGELLEQRLVRASRPHVGLHLQV